jgi:hypothetical protein
MKPDPVFSGEALKAVALLVVAIVVAVAAYAVATGNLGISLPDVNLPDTSTEAVTTLQDVSLEDTTINPTKPEAPQARQPDPFTSAGLASAIAKVRGAVGPGAELTRMFVNDVQTQFIVRTSGAGVAAYSVRADSGALDKQEATISVSGNATIDDFAFKLAAVKPAALDRILARARKLSGAADFRPSVVSVERDLSAGLKPPEWTINAEGNGRYLLFRAAIDGKRVSRAGGQGPAIPPAAAAARKLNDCVLAAGSDAEAIRGCFQQFTP